MAEFNARDHGVHEVSALRMECRLWAGLLAAVALGGCYRPAVLPQSEGHLVTPAPKATVENVPPPARVSSFVPPPKPAVKPPTYSVVVSEVPVKELLFALARDSKQNID